MLKTLCLVLTVFAATALASDFCPVKGVDYYCAWGCCYDDYTIYDDDPCCSAPVGLYVGAFLGSAGFVVLVIVLIYWRRRRMARVVQYTSPAPTTQVFATTGVANPYGAQQPNAYGAPPPNAYGVQPPKYSAY